VIQVGTAHEVMSQLLPSHTGSWRMYGCCKHMIFARLQLLFFFPHWSIRDTVTLMLALTHARTQAEYALAITFGSSNSERPILA
jgi:hypothetical protein